MIQDIQNIKEIGSKFCSKCQESSNQVIYLTRAPCEVGSEGKFQQLQKNVNAWGLQHSTWLSRKVMKIVAHAEGMLNL